jgi:hypothetical protein
VNELKPNVSANSNGQANQAADPNELKPNVSGDNSQTSGPPPQQVNEIQPGPSEPGPNEQPSADGKKTDASSSQDKADDATVSSSKHKKKKGLKKVVPF